MFVLPRSELSAYRKHRQSIFHWNKLAAAQGPDDKASCLAQVFQAQAVDLIRQLPLPNDLTRQIVAWTSERFVAWALLAASPILLIIGSLVKGI